MVKATCWCTAGIASVRTESHLRIKLVVGGDDALDARDERPAAQLLVHTNVTCAERSTCCQEWHILTMLDVRMKKRDHSHLRQDLYRAGAPDASDYLSNSAGAAHR